MDAAVSTLAKVQNQPSGVASVSKVLLREVDTATASGEGNMGRESLSIPLYANVIDKG